jgi:enoyl-CoA hydratase/carnithine racemase
MENIITSGYYDISNEDDIAIIRIKKNVFEFISDMKQSAGLFDFIDSINSTYQINAIFFYNDPDSFSEEEYDKFINRIMVDATAREESNLPCFTDKNVRSREINIMNDLIKRLCGLHVLVVAGIQGTVVTPYIGTVMSADLKYASEDARFSMAHNKYGLHPSGGLPFFLSGFLHHSKAIEIQFREKNISAQEALELGLINKILKKEDFENSAIEEIKAIISRINHCTIQHTKRLTNFRRKIIKDYFEYEGELLNL